MIKAVLLDLDNTLLHNPDRQFAGAFQQALDAHFRRTFGIPSIVPPFRAVIQRLGSHSDWQQPNAAHFAAAIAQFIDAPTEQVQDALIAFYAGPYDELRRCSAPTPSAAPLVECLLRQGFALAVATNPIYPAAAIHKRIEWAGLTDFMPEFAFVTHSENMHFAKPHPAYYAELIARIGIEPDETLMLGDSPKNDIRPAQLLGIHTRHIAAPDQLQTFYQQLQAGGLPGDYLPRPRQPAMIAPQYQGSIAALYDLLREVKPHQWHQRPDPDEWSIVQILCHLRESESTVQQKRLQTILQHDNPFIASLPPPGPHVPPCHSEGRAVLHGFQKQRRQTLALLEGLAPADWQRPARHSIFGLTSLLEMAHFTAQHDRLHIRQLCSTLGKCAD